MKNFAELDAKKSEKIGYSMVEKYRHGWAEVRLPDGRMLEGRCPMPYRLAKPLIDQKVHRVPVLLIQLPGEEQVWTIPAQI